ncbi:MAG TPA: hypothetical protein VKA94_07535 [Hyphomicrobiales bacterium]|nr:hypothetical protein [Hyphomicrobiales bacterium]
MKRLTTPEVLAFVVPVLAMITIVLLTAYASSIAGPGQNALSNLEPQERTAIMSF